MIRRRLISVLGWEERFLLGLQRSIARFKIETIDLLVYEEFRTVTKDHLNALSVSCQEIGCNLVQHAIHYKDPAPTWNYLQKWIKDEVQPHDDVWLDITTMPRETIWSVLSFLLQKDCAVHYIYWPPKSYNGDWLCKQPDKPRLLYKHSGVAGLDKDTALIILTGYDEERTAQLVFHYEPSLTLLGIQVGGQYSNDERNVLKIHGNRCKGATELKSFEIDAYEPNHGLSVLREVIMPLLTDYNVIVSSLGPKLSAISVYQFYQESRDVALTYVPTNEYNFNYSEGIGEAVVGLIERNE